MFAKVISFLIIHNSVPCTEEERENRGCGFMVSIYLVWWPGSWAGTRKRTIVLPDIEVNFVAVLITNFDLDSKFFLMELRTWLKASGVMNVFYRRAS